jgi:hypothetical protein
LEVAVLETNKEVTTAMEATVLSLELLQRLAVVKLHKEEYQHMAQRLLLQMGVLVVVGVCGTLLVEVEQQIKEIMEVMEGHLLALTKPICVVLVAVEKVVLLQMWSTLRLMVVQVQILEQQTIMARNELVVGVLLLSMAVKVILVVAVVVLAMEMIAILLMQWVALVQQTLVVVVEEQIYFIFKEVVMVGQV